MPRKQSGDRVSWLAAKWLRRLPIASCVPLDLTRSELAELRAICASALVLDETKGKRKRRA